MSGLYLIILWFAFIKLVSVEMHTQKCELVNGQKVLRERTSIAVVALIPLLYMVSTRNSQIGDTYSYEIMFKALPDTLRELSTYLSQVNKDKGFIVLGGIIKSFIGENITIYFFILALIQGVALLYVYKKYSDDFILSMFLFIVSTDYLSWMYNGIRQFTAVTIIFAATPLMVKRRWIPLVTIILIASTIHGSALLMLPVVFIVQGKAWNYKTIIFTIASIVALLFANQFTNILDILLSDTQYTNVVTDWKEFNDNGTNIIRVLVYSIPALLSLVGRRWINKDNDAAINLFTNMSIITAALYIVSAGTSGIFIGRLPIYTGLYSYILLPYLIKRIFVKDSERLVYIFMIGAYLVFYYYQVRYTWGLV